MSYYAARQIEQKRLKNIVRQNIYSEWIQSDLGSDLIQSLTNQIETGELSGGKAMHWEVGINSNLLGLKQAEVTKEPAKALAYGVLFKMADIAADNYSKLRQSGVSHQEALGYSIAEINQPGPNGLTAFDALMNKDTSGWLLSSMTKLDAEGKPYTQLVNQNVYTTELDKGMDAGSSFGVFVQNIADKTALGTLLTDVVDYWSGQSPELFTNYRAAAVRENLMQKDDDRMLKGGAYAASEVLGYAASIFENFAAARLLGTNSTWGIVGLNVAKGGLGDLQYSTGLEKRPDAISFLASRGYDLFTTALGLSVSQHLAELTGIGFAGAKAVYGIKDTIVQNGLIKSTIFPLGNAVLNTISDMTIDFSTHAVTKGIGIPYTQMQNARFDLDFSTPESAMQSYKNLGNQFLLRSAMVLGSGIMNNQIIARNKQPVVMSSKWIDDYVGNSKFVTDHPNLYKFQKLVANLAWSAYPGNLRMIDQMWHGEPGVKGTFGDAVANRHIAFDDYMVLWSNAEQSSNKIYKWLFNGKNQLDSKRLNLILGRYDLSFMKDLVELFPDATHLNIKDMDQAREFNAINKTYMKAWLEVKAKSQGTSVDRLQEGTIRELVDILHNVDMSQSLKTMNQGDAINIKNKLHEDLINTYRELLTPAQFDIAQKATAQLTTSIDSDNVPTVSRVTVDNKEKAAYFAALSSGKTNLLAFDPKVSRETVEKALNQLDQTISDLSEGNPNISKFVDAFSETEGNRTYAEMLGELSNGIKRYLQNREVVTHLDLLDALYKTSYRYLNYLTDEISTVIKKPTAKTDYAYDEMQALGLALPSYQKFHYLYQMVYTRLSPSQRASLFNKFTKIDSPLYKDKVKWSKVLSAATKQEYKDTSLEDTVMSLRDISEQNQLMKSQLTNILMVRKDLFDAIYKRLDDYVSQGKDYSVHLNLLLQNALSLPNSVFYNDVINQNMIRINGQYVSGITEGLVSDIAETVGRYYQSSISPSEQVAQFPLEYQNQLIGTVALRLADVIYAEHLSRNKNASPSYDNTGKANADQLTLMAKLNAQFKRVFGNKLGTGEQLIEVSKFNPDTNEIELVVKPEMSDNERQSLAIGMLSALQRNISPADFVGGLNKEEYVELQHLKTLKDRQNLFLKVSTGDSKNEYMQIDSVVDYLRKNDPYFDDNIRSLILLRMSEHSNNLFSVFQDAGTYSNLRDIVKKYLYQRNSSTMYEIESMGKIGNNSPMDMFLDSVIHKNMMKTDIFADAETQQLIIAAGSDADDISLRQYTNGLIMVEAKVKKEAASSAYTEAWITRMNDIGYIHMGNTGTTGDTALFIKVPWSYEASGKQVTTLLTDWSKTIVESIRDKYYDKISIPEGYDSYDAIISKINEISEANKGYEDTLKDLFTEIIKIQHDMIQKINDDFPAFVAVNKTQMYAELSNLFAQNKIAPIDAEITKAVSKIKELDILDIHGNKTKVSVESITDNLNTLGAIARNIDNAANQAARREYISEASPLDAIVRNMSLLTNEQKIEYFDDRIALFNKMREDADISEKTKSDIDSYIKFTEQLKKIFLAYPNKSMLESLQKTGLEYRPEYVAKRIDEFKNMSVSQKEANLMFLLLTNGYHGYDDSDKAFKRRTAILHKPSLNSKAIDYIIDNVGDGFEISITQTGKTAAGDEKSGQLNLTRGLNNLISGFTTETLQTSGKALFLNMLTKFNTHQLPDIYKTEKLDLVFDNIKWLSPDAFAYLIGTKNIKGKLTAVDNGSRFVASGPEALEALRFLLNSYSVHAEIRNDPGNVGRVSDQSDMTDPYGNVIASNMVMANIGKFTRRVKNDTGWISMDHRYNSLMAALRESAYRQTVSSRIYEMDDYELSSTDLTLGNSVLVSKQAIESTSRFAPFHEIEINVNGQTQKINTSEMVTIKEGIEVLAREAQRYGNDSGLIHSKEWEEIPEIIEKVFATASSQARLHKATLEVYTQRLLDFVSSGENPIYQKITYNLGKVFSVDGKTQLNANGLEYTDESAYVKISARYGLDNRWHLLPQLVAYVDNTDSGSAIGINRLSALLESADFDGDIVIGYPLSNKNMQEYVKAYYGLDADTPALKDGSNMFKYLLALQNTAISNQLNIAENTLYGNVETATNVADITQLGGLSIRGMNEAGTRVATWMALTKPFTLNIDVNELDTRMADMYTSLGYRIEDGTIPGETDDKVRKYVQHITNVTMLDDPDAVTILKMNRNNVFRSDIYGSFKHRSYEHIIDSDYSVRSVYDANGDVHIFGLKADHDGLAQQIISHLIVRNITDNPTILNNHANFVQTRVRGILIDAYVKPDGSAEPLESRLSKIFLTEAMQALPINIIKVQASDNLRLGASTEIEQQLYKSFVKNPGTKGHLTWIEAHSDKNTRYNDIVNFFTKIKIAESFRIGKNMSDNKFNPMLVIVENIFKDKGVDVTTLLENLIGKKYPDLKKLLDTTTNLKAMESFKDISDMDFSKLNTTIINKAYESMSEVNKHVKTAKALVDNNFIKESGVDGNDIEAAWKFFSSVPENKKIFLPLDIRTFYEVTQRASMTMEDNPFASLFTLPKNKLGKFSGESIQKWYNQRLGENEKNYTNLMWFTDESKIQADRMWKAIDYLDILDNSLNVTGYKNYLRYHAKQATTEKIYFSADISSKNDLVTKIMDTIVNTVGSRTNIYRNDIVEYLNLFGIDIGPSEMVFTMNSVNTIDSSGLNFFSGRDQSSALSRSIMQYADTDKLANRAILYQNGKEVKAEHLVDSIRHYLQDGRNNVKLSAYEQEVGKTIFTALLGSLEDNSHTRVSLVAHGLDSKIANQLAEAIDTDGPGWKLDAMKVIDIDFRKGKFTDILNRNQFDQLFFPLNITRTIDMYNGICN